MDVALSPDLERQLAETLEEGRYASASEVISEGLRLLFAANLTRTERLAQLHDDLQVGLDELDRGEGIPGEIVREELNALLKRA